MCPFYRFENCFICSEFFFSFASLFKIFMIGKCYKLIKCCHIQFFPRFDLKQCLAHNDHMRTNYLFDTVSQNLSCTLKFMLTLKK